VFLRRGDCGIALGHGNFLRGQEEFERVPLRDQIRLLENDALRVSFSYFPFIRHIIPLTVLVGYVVYCSVSEFPAGHSEGSCKEIENPRRRLYLMKESYKIYIENKEGIWVKMGNHLITQIQMT